jgi:hypothetical protein
MELEMTELAARFESELKAIETALHAVPPAITSKPFRLGGWTRKQLVGHLCDSAANNRQRFVRASIDGNYAGPGYAQDAWVDAHGYAAIDWDTLLAWWRTEHQILMAVVARIPESRFETSCIVGQNAPVSLRFLIEDYIAHQQHHLRQIQAPDPVR